MTSKDKEFPLLKRKISNSKIVYLDNAATSQKPNIVLKAIKHYYEMYNANVHRGIHLLSREATELMEDSRKAVQEFINAKFSHEIIFTKGTTEAINLVASSIEPLIKKDDEILISTLEHHSNIVPWQMLAERTSAKIIPILLDDNCDIDLEDFNKKLNSKTKIIAVNHISNALGVVNPIKYIIDKAHEFDAIVLVDAAQSIAHTKIDVQELNPDFLVFSGHKMYAPTGVGVLYGKENLLNSMKPYQGGGEMIKEVSFDKTTYADLPFKFEAGTPNIAGNIVLKTSIDYIKNIGFEYIQNIDRELINYLTDELSNIHNINIYAKNAKERTGAVSFNLKIKDVHPSDVGFILDKQGISVRTGHHCCQPLMNFLNVKGTIRASFGVYNTKEDIDKLIEGIKITIKLLK